MIDLHIAFTCHVCDNKTAFYGMPLDEKLPNGEEVVSKNHFLIRCAKCGQKYHLHYSLKRI